MHEHRLKVAAIATDNPRVKYILDGAVADVEDPKYKHLAPTVITEEIVEAEDPRLAVVHSKADDPRCKYLHVR